MKDENGIEYSLADFIADAKVSPKKIIIFGAGDVGNYIYSKLIEANIDIEGFCDNRRAGELKFDKKIYDISELENNKEIYFVVGVFEALAKISIKHQLLKHSIQMHRIVIPIPMKGEKFYTHGVFEESELRTPYIEMLWDKTKESSKIYRYFSSNKLNKLVVYSCGVYEKDLENNLAESDVKIVQIIDSIEKTLVDDFDALFVLDEDNFEKIEDYFLGKINKPIVSLLEVIG